MIRGHAYWALGRSFPRSDRLHAVTESVPEASDEWQLALLMVERPAWYGAVLDADEWARQEDEVVGLALTRAEPMSLVVFHREGEPPTHPLPGGAELPMVLQAIESAAPEPLLVVYDRRHRLAGLRARVGRRSA